MNQEMDVPNPMLDSVRVPAGRKMLMTVGGSKSRLFTPPTIKHKMMSLQQINNMTDSETETTVKYEQFAFLQPKNSHKLIPSRNSDIINGEECTITMRVLVKDTCLPEIFHKTAMGYTIQLADTAEKYPEEIDSIEEIEEVPPPPQLIEQASSAKAQFKRATKRIQQFRLVSDALKQVEDEKLTKANIQIDLDSVNNFLNTFNLVQSNHLLKDSIEQDRKRSMRRFMRQAHTMKYNENCPQTPYQQKSKDTCMVCGAIVVGLIVVFCLAYMKSSINELQITDL